MKKNYMKQINVLVNYYKVKTLLTTYQVKK